MLIEHLPPGSASLQHLVDEDRLAWEQWTDQHELLAQIVDAVQRLTWAFVMAHTPEGKVPPREPAPVPRPPVPREVVEAQARRRREQHATESQMAAAFGVPFNPAALPPGGAN